jgi:N-acetylglucosaminyldiphosphoundecaprenol N-acetyl-beta-D-mannosaminyltransferase
MGFDPAGPAADAAIDAIGQSGARLVFLALGAPKQEIFAARAFGRLPGAGFVSIGAGLDFISGAQRRAPKLVRLLAAEWLWRMALSPRRLAGRYAACLAALPPLTTRALAARMQGAGAEMPGRERP